MFVNFDTPVYDSRNDCNAIIETATNTLISGCKASTIPEDVTSVGGLAFYGCSGLTFVRIPASVTELGQEAFGCCSGLDSIVCEAVVPPTIGGYVFEYVPKDIPLYVPEGSIPAYQAANEWSAFTNIRALLDEHEGFDQITNEQSPMTKKFFRDGRLLIIRNDQTYTVDGRLTH